MIKETPYFISIIPPQGIYKLIKEHQKTMSDKFDSHKSYRHVPHITLIPPFHIQPDKEVELKDHINAFYKTISSFQIQLDGFSHFKKHTLFIDVKKTAQLAELQIELLNSLNERKDIIAKKINYFQRFRPHITIAYKDLKPNFNAAWDHFSTLEITENFECNAISLHKYGNKGWKEISLN